MLGGLMKRCLFIIFSILIVSCASEKDYPKIDDNNEKSIQYFEELKQKYPNIIKTSGTPENIVNYITINNVKEVRFDSKMELANNYNNILADDKKFSSLFINPLDVINIKKMEINISDQNLDSEYLLYVDMYLSMNIEHGNLGYSNSIIKFDYIYTYKLLKGSEISAKNIYHKTYYYFNSTSTGSDILTIADYWE